MIVLHRMDGSEIILNSTHIEIIEEKPDTIITLTNDKKYLVTEKADEIIDKVIEFNRKSNEKFQ